jgi:hypothetical protein
MKFRTKVLTTVFCVIFASGTFAQSLFFEQQSGSWTVYGKPKTGDLNPSCNGERKYQDGSFFSLIRDLDDGELYILFHNVAWNISDNPGVYQMRMNFYKGSSVVSLSATYELLNKNTLRVRALNVERFLPPFIDYSRMVFIMPGNIPNVEVKLDGTRSVVSDIVKCVSQYKPPRQGMNL